MAYNRSEMKTDAKNQLSGYWGAFIPALLVVVVVSGLITFIFYPDVDSVTSHSLQYALLGVVGTIIQLLIMSPLNLGWYAMAVDRTYDRTVTFQSLFNGFKRIWDAVLIFFFVGLFIFLWSLLLFIPGVIKTYSYSMSYYILIDNPGMKPLDAITKSREMMNGHKWELFVLQLSFIPWFLLVCVTFGIASLYVAPYIEVTTANFYRRLKAEDEVKSLGGYAPQDQYTAPAAPPVQEQEAPVEAPEVTEAPAEPTPEVQENPETDEQK